MNIPGSAVLAALLLATAVLLWPRRRPGSFAFAGPAPHATAGQMARSGADSGDTRSLWQEDPVELFRRWRLRRRPGVLVDDVLELLRGIGPALEAGLTPARAIELSATSTLGADRVARGREAVGSSRGRRRARGERPAGPPTADIDRLVGALLEGSHRGEPTSQVWTEWARRSASAELALVAAAWRLSETTGAPLASAVQRAVRGLLDARARRGKVAVAVAGPRATVTVLTLLPLSGPLFGLACGVGPSRLYLGSPVATACAVGGLVLVWTGRVWCSRMVRGAVTP
ncbi:hypothetical protein [Terrabacter sp. NPDC080008]|uniref:type II secretion system F family protein n=1 Tax=Terrabacter sp. NPDC080008 TaxID=3155176 RepID=UPI00344CCFDC